MCECQNYINYQQSQYQHHHIQIHQQNNHYYCRNHQIVTSTRQYYNYEQHFNTTNNHNYYNSHEYQQQQQQQQYYQHYQQQQQQQQQQMHYDMIQLFSQSPTSNHHHHSDDSTTSNNDYYQDSNNYHTSSNRTSSSNQLIRNLQEKQRRDKYNQLVNELALLVPMTANSVKKLDKISILRLSAAYLRFKQMTKPLIDNSTLRELTALNMWSKIILEEMGYLFLIVTSKGKIVFISEEIEGLLGYHQNDLFGQLLSSFTSHEDHEKLERVLKPDYDQPSTSAEGDESILARRREGRRSFYLRLQRRVVSKSDKPHYECVHIEGQLKVAPHLTATKKHRGDQQSVDDKIVLVAVMKPIKEVRITAHSLLEATKEEWISRHLIDGTIVYSDHRISVVSGYLSDEVSGKQGFIYMHEDDARYVIIALRTMYYRGESYGASCYRLLAKTGEFIYIRTHGFLELNEDSNSVQSIICINSLVSPEEGEKLIAEMKALFSSVAVQENEPGISGLAESRCITQAESSISNTSALFRPLKVCDPTELKTATEQLLAAVPSNKIQVTPSSPTPGNQQYVKVAMISKEMPPVSLHTSKIGVKEMPCLKQNARFNRPSVITQLPRNKDKSKRGGPTEEKESVLKRIRSEETSVIVSERSVIRPVTREEIRVQQPPPYHGHDPPIIQQPQPQSTSTTSFDCNDFFLIDPENPHFPNVHGPLIDATIEMPAHHVELEVPVDGLGLWECEEEVVRGQIQLESRMQTQESQLFDIDNDLSSVSTNSDGCHILRTRYTHLKDEHRKQKEELKTLTQHCKEV